MQSAFDELHGKFSPDGPWLAYASNETGRYEVYVRAFPGLGGKRQVSTGGGIFPRWRRDGREVFFVAPDNSIMAVAIAAGSDAQTVNPGSATALFRSPLGFSSSSPLTTRPPGRSRWCSTGRRC
jgi:eukaryotic-like serine/threonine-protein kinase